MVDPKVNTAFPTQSTTTAELRRAMRGVENDAIIAQLARRIRDGALLRPRRHVKTTLRPLTFPVWVAGIMARAVVTVYYVQPRPREKSQEVFWFASVEDAKSAFPTAQMIIPDAPCVGRSAC